MSFVTEVVRMRAECSSAFRPSSIDGPPLLQTASTALSAQHGTGH
jgi:hypothetical protein